MSTNISSPVTPSLHLQANNQAAIAAKQQNNNELQQPTKVVNPADDTKDTNLSTKNNDGKDVTQNMIDQIKQLIGSKFNYPLGETSSTIYRDPATRQYMVATTDRKNGKITYTPESTLATLSPGIADSVRSNLPSEA